MKLNTSCWVCFAAVVLGKWLLLRTMAFQADLTATIFFRVIGMQLDLPYFTQKLSICVLHSKNNTYGVRELET